MKVPVLLPKLFNHPFTYSFDSKLFKKFDQGELVTVPFGKNHSELGVVWDEIKKTKKKIRIKNIENKIPKIKLNKKMIKFINWFSKYNITSKGMVLKMCLGNQKNFQEEKLKQNVELEKKINFNLNKDQNKALDDLIKFGNKFSVSVLLGVTGSGKTLVYFKRIKKIIDQNKQALILIPEIFLTSQFKERFENFFGYEPAIWHSKITPKNKRQIWRSVVSNNVKIIIGARSSLFLPFKNLGLIIVDEEHDPSYKQEDGVIYNARDMAISRASIENIPIHLVTSIPSLETYENIKKKKYKKTELKKRFKNFPLPKTKIINLDPKDLKKSSISQDALTIVEQYLKKNEQVLFFLNRRGYAPFLICKKCGYRHICPNCSIYLTFHKIIEKSICHHCGFKNELKNNCADKKSLCDFSFYGPGVEKVYEELKKIFPNKKIKIFSSDYMLRNKQSESLINQITNKKVDILVGTQMISKGFNFPKLNCIVVVDADFSGKGYDLRTTEKNIQLYNQLSGRAGRFSSDSTIIYQTIEPNHKILKDLVKNSPENFLEEELKIREVNNLPPYSRLIAVIISANSKENSYRGALEIKKKLNEILGIKIMGPVESPIFKRKKKFRTRLLLRSKRDFFSQIYVSKILEKLKISSKIKLTVDVDPINFT